MYTGGHLGLYHSVNLVKRRYKSGDHNNGRIDGDEIEDISNGRKLIIMLEIDGFRRLGPVYDRKLSIKQATRIELAPQSLVDCLVDSIRAVFCSKLDPVYPARDLTSPFL